jgi:hypothetical protein
VCEQAICAELERVISTEAAEAAKAGDSQGGGGRVKRKRAPRTAGQVVQASFCRCVQNAMCTCNHVMVTALLVRKGQHCCDTAVLVSLEHTLATLHNA